MIGKLGASDDKLAEAARVIASMKPAFVSCQRGPSETGEPSRTDDCA